MTYLAVSISAKSEKEALPRIDQAIADGAEMVEIRADYLEPGEAGAIGSLISAVHARQVPVIVTCRSPEEGGVNDCPAERRIEVLREAAAQGADYVDCEYRTYTTHGVKSQVDAALAAHPRCRLILSCHDFKGCFEDIRILQESILTVCPTAIPKLVYTARSISDNFEALDLLHENEPEQDMIVLTMGPSATLSRVLAKKFGSFLTFASLDEATATAWGQTPVRQMKTLYRWDGLDGRTEVYGIIGNPVGHSISPAVYNACFEAAKINAVYLPLPVEGGREEFDLFLHNVVHRPWLEAGGFSVTIPHKTHALSFALEGGNFVESLPVRIGAVNTLKIGFNGIVTGYNTDLSGAMEALTETLGIALHDLHQVRAAVIGAGGAARAVVAGLTEAGAQVTIYNRTLSRARALAAEFHCEALAFEAVEELDAEVVINCTSIGMHPNTEASPVPASVWKPGMVAFDTVYNPLETLFLRQAAAAGARTVNGAEMFIRQAIAQYRRLIGQEPDEKLIRRVVYSRLS